MITRKHAYLLTSGSEYGPPEAWVDAIASQYISDDVSFTEYGLFKISRVDFNKTVSVDAIFTNLCVCLVGFSQTETFLPNLTTLQPEVSGTHSPGNLDSAVLIPSPFIAGQQPAAKFLGLQAPNDIVI